MSQNQKFNKMYFVLFTFDSFKIYKPITDLTKILIYIKIKSLNNKKRLKIRIKASIILFNELISFIKIEITKILS